MNEWQSIAWFSGIGSIIFGAIWVIVADVRRGLTAHIKDVDKGCHARIDRSDHVIDEIVRDCHKKTDHFITTKGFDRFENHINTKFDGMSSSINHLTTRIDDFIKSNRNGNGDRKSVV